MKKKYIEEVKDFIEEIDQRIERKEFVRIIKNRYSDLPQSTLYSFYRKMKMNLTISFKELMKEIQNDYLISHFPEVLEEGELPTILIITNDEMKKNYEQFGKSVSFDLTFSLFKEKPVQQEIINEERGKMPKEYLLGFFAGLNNLNKTIIFGLVITCATKMADQSQIFNEFVDHMEG